MKKTYLYEEKLPPKLPISLSSEIKNNINLIKDYNQNNLESLYQWYDYIDNLKNYISNRKIAWDYANRYSHFPNGAIHLTELGYDVYFIVSTDKIRNINYVYVFKANLKPEEFGLKIPPTLKENKIRYTNNTMKTNKKVIRLTESDLHLMIEKAVKKVLKEGKRDFREHSRLKRPFSMLESTIYAFEDAIGYSDDDLREDSDMRDLLDCLYRAKTIVINKFMTHIPSVEETMYGD